MPVLGREDVEVQDPTEVDRLFRDAVRHNQPSVALYHLVVKLDDMASKIQELEAKLEEKDTKKVTAKKTSSKKTTVKEDTAIPNESAE